MPEFNFQALSLVLAGVSFGFISVLLAGSALFPEQAEKAKRTWLPNVIIGLILLGISSAILGTFGG